MNMRLRQPAEAFLKAEPLSAAASDDGTSSARHHAPGERIHEAGASGSAWRVISGVVRLDAPEGADGRLVFAGLAVPGDIVGAETRMFGLCFFGATALTPTKLSPWPGATAPQADFLMNALARAERRTARMMGLRAGQAIDRVKRLIQLLVPHRDGEAFIEIELPSLRDIADITALTMETVSRSLSGLRRQGMLEPSGQRRGNGRKNCRCRVPDAPAAA